MGRLSGFSYREIARCLKALGFAFDRQAAGSHEIWYHEKADRYTTSPTILAICLKELFEQSLSKPESHPTTSWE